MGNVLSEEDQEERFIEDGFNLESPDADKVINYGTAAPVWQNKKSSSSSRSLENNDTSHQPIRNENNNNESNHRNNSNDVGQEVMVAPQTSVTTNSEPLLRRQTNDNSSTTEDTQQPDIDETPKKLSYIQMAKLGYQELINAIIRPPRADYKVRAKHFGK